MLHGASFAGAVAVFIGYSFISIGGMYRFGSWLAWENAVGARAGTVMHDRGFAELATQKAYEHLWPLIAALIDTAGCFALVMVQGHGVPTVNFRTDYLRPAINTSLIARAAVRRVGRTVGVVDVDVYDDADKLIAVGRGTFGTTAG